MKRKGISGAAVLLVVMLGSSVVHAEEFPYRIDVEMQEINEAYLYLTEANIEIESEQYPELAAAVTTWAAEREQERTSAKEQYAEQAAIDAENLGDSFYGYSISESIAIVRADERILSLKEERYEYQNGVYPVSLMSGVNFDVQTGELLELEDILADVEGFKSAAVDFIVGYMREVYSEYEIEVTAEQIQNFWDTEMEWYLNASGVNLIFNEDTLGPHALGIVEIPMTIANAQDYLKEEYAGFGDTGVYALQENIPIEIPDGEEKLSLLLNVEAGEFDWTYSVMSGGNNLDLGQCGYMQSAYYLRKADGSNYLMFDVDIASDDFTTYLFRIEKDGITKTDELGASIDEGGINPDTFDMEFWLYTLGTYGAEKTYSINENGIFVTDETEYTLRGNVESRFELKTTVELPFFIDGRATVIPAGAGLRMLATDDENYAVMQVTETGQVGELPFVRGDGENSWNIYIGDKNAEECFEMLPYVG